MALEDYIQITSNLEDNHIKLDELLGLSKNFDVGNRDFVIQNKTVRFYYVTGLCDSENIMYLFAELPTLIRSLDENPEPPKKISEIVKYHLIHQQVEETQDLQKLATDVLSGLLGVVIEGETTAYVVDVRSYPTRGVGEPEIEKTVRGSKDGFTENIIVNTALLRRRIRDGNLRMEIYKIGDSSKTDVVLTYIEGIADEKLINNVRKKLMNIKTNVLTMTDRDIQEHIVRKNFNPFPLVRYTERPDVLAEHLYQGMFGIMTDTSPSVIMAPITLFDHLSNIEEYRQTSIVGTMTRLLRTCGVFGAIFIVPLWYLFVKEPELLPTWLEYIGPKEFGNIPIIVQLLIAEVGVEFLRMAAVHTPSSLSTALGIVAGILVGQIAVEVGLFSPEVVLYVAISAIGTYTTPSYELGLANKFMKFLILIATAVFGLYGFIGGVAFYFIFLLFTKSFGKPYLYPLMPLNLKDLKHAIFRTPYNRKR